MKKSVRIISTICLLCPIYAQANDYPTQARVEYVLQCMNKHGGANYDTLYPCVCSIDKIAAAIPYEKYVESETFSYMVKTPGEKGGAFRDAPGARGMVKSFAKVVNAAEDSCFVKK